MDQTLDGKKETIESMGDTAEVFLFSMRRQHPCPSSTMPQPEAWHQKLIAHRCMMFCFLGTCLDKTFPTSILRNESFPPPHAPTALRHHGSRIILAMTCVAACHQRITEISQDRIEALKEKISTYHDLISTIVLYCLKSSDAPERDSRRCEHRSITKFQNTSFSHFSRFSSPFFLAIHRRLDFLHIFSYASGKQELRSPTWKLLIYNCQPEIHYMCST